MHNLRTHAYLPTQIYAIVNVSVLADS